MKKTIIFILIIAVLVIPVFAFAHSGRTDSSGGHTDRDTGEYHYHHGYSAHQHTDGVCPYDNTATQGRMSLLDEWNSSPKVIDRYDAGYNDGYDEGYNVGHGVGRDEGYYQGKSAGYDQGFADGKPIVPKWCYVVFGVAALIIVILICKIREK